MFLLGWLVKEKRIFKLRTEYTVVRRSDGSILYQPKYGYDIWADSSLDNFDYATELQREYLDLGYNPREVRTVGREKFND